jgi:hypothetical protein
MNENEIIGNFFLKQQNDTVELRQDIQTRTTDQLRDTRGQRRVFYQNLALLLGAAIGLVSIAGTSEIKNIAYFKFGLGLYVFFVLILILYLKETLDRDSEEIQNLGDQIDYAIEEKLNLVKTYLVKKVFTNAEKNNFIDALQELPYIEDLKNLNKKITTGRDNRLKGDKDWDFSGEIFVSLFLSSGILITTSLISKISLFEILELVIIALLLTFSNKTLGLFRKINQLFNVLLAIKNSIIRNKK